MSEGVDIKKWILSFIRNDLRIIATFLFAILIITYGFAAMMGFITLGSSDYRTPAISPENKSGLVDTDGDSLPDVVEDCPEGEPAVAIRDNGQRDVVGTCTGTDPNDIDTDNDGFTDSVENAIGTPPRNFWNPGWLYIVIAIYASAFLFFRVYEGDPLKEYKEFEMKASAGVSGSGGKFAYGGKSTFGSKSTEEVSDEERRRAIESDPRFQKMTDEQQSERPKIKKKRNFTALLIQFAIATLIGIFIFILARAA